MASPIIHLQRHVKAVLENNQQPMAINTIIDGNLRPVTAKQLKNQQALAWASKETQVNHKELHNHKIRSAARVFQFELEKQGYLVNVDWSKGQVLTTRMIKNA